MLEILTVLTFIGYLVYLSRYADQRSHAQKEADRLQEGITLYENGQLEEALAYFDRELFTNPKSGVGHLYRARIHRALGDLDGARADLVQGTSYDATLAELHLESGQLYFEAGNYQQAFLDFDKAVFHSFGQAPEPYRWRGMARQRLHQDEASQQDLARARVLAEAPPLPTAAPGPPSVFNRRFLLNLSLAALSGLLVLLVIQRDFGIHTAYFVGVLSGFGSGLLEPRLGWALTLLQVSVILLGHTFFSSYFSQSDMAAFSLYGSVGLILVGGLLGGVLKRNVV